MPNSGKFTGSTNLPIEGAEYESPQEGFISSDRMYTLPKLENITEVNWIDGSPVLPDNGLYKRLGSVKETRVSIAVRTNNGSYTAIKPLPHEPVIPEPEKDPYITFSSDEDFTLFFYDVKSWDGTLEYSTDSETWTTVVGEEEEEMQSVDGVIYLRGSNNTVITGGSNRFVITSTTPVRCDGTIEMLLDWETVIAGDHPVIGGQCFAGLFRFCTSLISGPDLPSNGLSYMCCHSMFYGCSSLVEPPNLPATVMAERCYEFMFQNCTSLVTAPELPATILAEECYLGMFSWCGSLEEVPSILPVMNLEPGCYESMFENCQSLINPPTLPATIMADGCYYGMFWGCTSLTAPPELPAIVLANECYSNMFRRCSNLLISDFSVGGYIHSWRIPTSGTIGTGPYEWNYRMFYETGGDFTDDPGINTTYWVTNAPV